MTSTSAAAAAVFIAVRWDDVDEPQDNDHDCPFAATVGVSDVDGPTRCHDTQHHAVARYLSPNKPGVILKIRQIPCLFCSWRSLLLQTHGQCVEFFSRVCSNV